MNKKIEEYQIKANKIVRTVKLIGITVFLLGIIMSIIWYTINKTKNDLKNARNAEIIKEDDYENSGNGVTYYVSMNGISGNGYK